MNLEKSNLILYYFENSKRSIIASPKPSGKKQKLSKWTNGPNSVEAYPMKRNSQATIGKKSSKSALKVQPRRNTRRFLVYSTIAHWSTQILVKLLFW